MIKKILALEGLWMMHGKSLDWNGKRGSSPSFPFFPHGTVICDINFFFLPCGFTVLKLPTGNYTDSWVAQEQLLYQASQRASCQLY